MADDEPPRPEEDDPGQPGDLPSQPDHSTWAFSTRVMSRRGFRPSELPVAQTPVTVYDGDPSQVSIPGGDEVDEVGNLGSGLPSRQLFL